MTMRIYDRKRAKAIIEQEQAQGRLLSASLGIIGSSYIAEEIWNKEDGFLFDVEETKNIANTRGSAEGIPAISLTFQGGVTTTFPCFKVGVSAK